MPNYQNGRIYKLYSPSNPNLVYIGSTTQTLSRRLVDHKCRWKVWKQTGKGYRKSFDIFENCDDYRIELLELCPCDSREELLRTEGKYIQQLSTVNQQIAGRTRSEYREDNKEHIKEQRRIYREKNRENIKLYYAKNKDKFRESNRARYQVHRDERIQKQREYNEQNRQKINQRQREYDRRNRVNITCECGKVMQKGSLPRHLKRDIHKKRMMTK